MPRSAHFDDYGLHLRRLHSAVSLTAIAGPMSASSSQGGQERCFTDGAIEVVVTRLDPTPDALVAMRLWLSDAERERADRFHFERDRRRFIVARARLRQLLAARLGVGPESVELVYSKNGKPGLAHRFGDTDWRFNVSHCDDVAVYAFSPGREIGIDIEAIRAVREADDIAARFFSRREKEAYLSLAPRDKPLGFLRCWTRKEAFVKALGSGLSVRLDQLDVSQSTLGEHGGWRLDSFSPLPGFIAAVATHRG